MVDFSLRKARSDWKKGHSPVNPALSPSRQPKSHSPSPAISNVNSASDNSRSNGNHAASSNGGKRDRGNKKNANPYAAVDMANSYTKLPKINAHEKNKAASSMQRRLSIYNPNFTPPSLDYSRALPTGNLPTSMNSGRNINNPRDNNRSNQDNDRTSFSIEEITQPNKLKSVLANQNFNAKTFVHNNLRNASAMDIDNFTTTLTDLSENIRVEAKDNINRSYKEIMQVNSDLTTASSELETLRGNIDSLNKVMKAFDDMATRRIELEENSYNLNSRTSSSNPPQLQPALDGMHGDKRKRDMGSIAIIEKIWSDEMNQLEREIEGSSRILRSKNGRHLILKSEDWMELNVATLRYLNTVKLYILNDIIIVAGKNKNNDYTFNQSLNMKEIKVNLDIGTNNRLIIKNNSNGSSLTFQSINERECSKVLDCIRKAKDDLSDIFQSEKQNEQRLKESFRYIQSTSQTPMRDSNVSKSPIKTNRYSMGTSVTPGRTNSILGGGNGVNSGKTGMVGLANDESATDQYLLQSITMSMNPNFNDLNGVNNSNVSFSKDLKEINDNIEEIDINIARYKLDKASDIILENENILSQLYDQLNENDLMFHNILLIKLNKRHEIITSKLSQNILFNNEISQLMSNVSTMIKLGMAEQGLDLFLQNRSNAIQELILQTGSFDNVTNYLTQLSVVRFQTIRQTVLNYETFFKQGITDQYKQQQSMTTNSHNMVDTSTLQNKLSSILVNWCSSEVDKHFKMINEQLINDETISPLSIKSSRKQIDELKSVGLDFVYKLDEFIRANSHRIG